MNEQLRYSEDSDARRGRLAGWLLRQDAEVVARFARNYEVMMARPRNWRRRLQRRAAVTVAGAALLLAMAGFGVLAQPRSTITVVNGEVNPANNDKCSLVEAIDNANDTADGQPHDDCAAGDPNGADVIVLPAGGSFNVTKYIDSIYGYNGLPPITTTITVQGNGSTVSRTGNKDMRLLAVGGYEPYAGDLTLNDLTLTGGTDGDIGYSGGAIYNYYGEVTINNCTITGNQMGGTGGGVYATGGSLTITDSIITDNESYGGAGVHVVEGTLSISDSTISNNRGQDGGGGGVFAENTIFTMDGATVTGNTAGTGAGVYIMYSDALISDSLISGNDVGEVGLGGGVYLGDAAVTLQDVTVADNTAYRGGGVFAYNGETMIKGSTLSGNAATKDGGGLYTVDENVMTMANSTVSGNSATELGGGIVAGGTSLTLINATVSDNAAGTTGGGLEILGGATVMERTLLSGNTAPAGPEAHLTAGTAQVDGANVFGHSGAAGLVGLAAGATDVVPAGGLATVLGALADNTGPTMTHALPPGSPAIDRGASAACMADPIGGTDQRGQPRNVDGNGAGGANECDAGAYEFQAGGPVDTPTPTVTATPTTVMSPTPTATATDGPTPTRDPRDFYLYLPVTLGQ